jgi:hypothetical protein
MLAFFHDFLDALDRASTFSRLYDRSDAELADMGLTHRDVLDRFIDDMKASDRADASSEMRHLNPKTA